MTEPSAAVKEKLAKASARRAVEENGNGGAAPEAPSPITPVKQPTILDDVAPDGSPAAGNGVAKYLLVDHFFGGATGTFWAYDGTTWRAANTAEPADEQGLAQVAFASNKVEVWWDNNNAVTVVRSWKYF